MKPSDTEFPPERIWLQVLRYGSIVAYESNPLEVHDNGKPVYVYQLTDLAVPSTTVGTKTILIASRQPDYKLNNWVKKNLLTGKVRMKTIYKVELKITDVQTIELPSGAEILTVQNQRNSLCLWALVETDAKLVSRVIEIIGTGNPIEPRPRKYIGTAQISHGEFPFVWHVFEQFARGL
jgi:hypothetical protein